MTSAAAAPALKEILNAERFRHVAKEAAAVYPRFASAAFLAHALPGLDDLTLMQRLRRMTESLHGALPADYKKATSILRQLAPRIDHGFVTLVLPDYVGRYGQEDFDTSMEALKFFTAFGSSEFAVREFLRREPARTLAVMKTWSLDSSEHVRRLASEGSRPRLPWSFRLDALMADPNLAARGILQKSQHGALGETIIIGSHIRLDGAIPDLPRPSPLLGEHTDEVLQELGLTEDEVGMLYVEEILA